MNKLLISILIPFYGAEAYFSQCLESTANQSYSNIEVIISNDCSIGKDKNGKTVSEIVKDFSEKYKDKKNFKLRFFENRRFCVEQSKGAFCCFLDSDDTLLPECIDFLYEKAIDTNADIVQGTTKLLYNSQTPEEHISSMKKSAELVHEGILLKEEIAEDFLLYYFISRYSKKYAGFRKNVYEYNLNTGLSSFQTIQDIERWKRIYTATSTFTILYTYFEEHDIPKNHKIAIQKFCWSFLANSIKTLHSFVAPEIYNQAYNIICNYWGKSFVEKADAIYNKVNQEK